MRQINQDLPVHKQIINTLETTVRVAKTAKQVSLPVTSSHVKGSTDYSIYYAKTPLPVKLAKVTSGDIIKVLDHFRKDGYIAECEYSVTACEIILTTVHGDKVKAPKLALGSIKA